VVALRRLRSLGGGPVALDERCMPADLAERCGFTAEVAGGSMVGHLRRHLPLARARWVMRAVAATPEIAGLLLVDPGTPLLERSLSYRDSSGAVAMTGRTLHRSDLLACEIELPLDAADPAV
jgi:GntR family transcriptional regulator